MAATWNPSDKDSQWTLSGSDLTATLTVVTNWWTARATHGFSPFIPGGMYWEVQVNGAFTNVMLGTTRLATGLGVTYNQPGAAYMAASGTSYVGSGNLARATAGVWNTGATRIGLFVRDGKTWFSVNGVFSSSGDPALDTYPNLYNYPNNSADVYPTVCGYSPSGQSVTLCAAVGSLNYSPPTGAKTLDSHFNLSTTLVDTSNNPITSHAVKWAVFYQATPDSLALIDATGTGTTDGSGVLVIDYDYTSIPVGGTCSVLISDTNGTADLNCKSVYLARAPTIT